MVAWRPVHFSDHQLLCTVCLGTQQVRPYTDGVGRSCGRKVPAALLETFGNLPLFFFAGEKFGGRRSALVSTPPPARSSCIQRSDVLEQCVDRTGLGTVKDVCCEVDQLDAVSERVTGLLDMIDGKHNSNGIDNKDRNNGQLTNLPLSNGSDTGVRLRVGEVFANGSISDGAQLISTRPRRATANYGRLTAAVDRGELRSHKRRRQDLEIWRSLMKMASMMTVRVRTRWLMSLRLTMKYL